MIQPLVTDYLDSPSSTPERSHFDSQLGGELHLAHLFEDIARVPWILPRNLSIVQICERPPALCLLRRLIPHHPTLHVHYRGHETDRNG
jgi:hypothetical protein